VATNFIVGYQSGGSTPGALRLYGIPDNAYSGDVEMFRLMHEMRVRIMTAPAFTGAKVIAMILFEGTKGLMPGCARRGYRMRTIGSTRGQSRAPPQGTGKVCTEAGSAPVRAESVS
jgi:fructose-bisphosphate aldolase class 1